MIASEARSGQDLPLARTIVGSVVMAGGVSTVVAAAFAAGSVACRHWFVLPVTLCGTLIGIDALRWLQGRLGRFDPVGILGLLGWHFFFLAPLLHVALDSWMPWVEPPADWREWLGRMACLNALGLVAYRTWLAWATEPIPDRAPRLGVLGGTATPSWVIDRSWFFPVAGIVLAVSGILQAWVYVQHGGIISYMESATDLRNRNTMQGWGIIYLISESFPVVFVMAFAVIARQREAWRSWPAIFTVLGISFVLFMLFGGLRGSRSNTIWGLFWAVGIVHFFVRPIPKRLIAVGAGFLVAFMYAYGLYKGAGLRALQSVGDAQAQLDLAERTDRTLETLLLGDLGRTDIQAFLLHRISRHDSDYEYALGRTYLGAVAILVPRALWPDRPPIKSKEGTEAQFGKDNYAPEVLESSRVYGLAGETLLNFGPVAVPFAFLFLAAVVAPIQRLQWSLVPGDARLLLLPFMVSFCFMILVSDLDNLIFNLIKNLAVPFAVVALCSTRYEVRER